MNQKFYSSYHHNFKCPGLPEQKECKTCQEKRLLVTGHYKDMWSFDPKTGKTTEVYYTTPACVHPNRLLKKDVAVQMPTDANALRRGVPVTVEHQVLELPLSL